MRASPIPELLSDSELTDDQITDHFIKILAKTPSQTNIVEHCFRLGLNRPESIKRGNRIMERLLAENVFRLDGNGIFIPTHLVFDIEEKFNGWFGYKEHLATLEADRHSRNKLEVELAKSNIRANQLNELNEKFNRRTTKVNIIIGIINVLAAIVTAIVAYLTLRPGQ